MQNKSNIDGNIASIQKLKTVKIQIYIQIKIRPTYKKQVLFFKYN